MCAFAMWPLGQREIWFFALEQTWRFDERDARRVDYTADSSATAANGRMPPRDERRKRKLEVFIAKDDAA